MSNITITENDNGSVALHVTAQEDGVVTASTDLLEGTLMARHATSGVFLPYATSGADGVDEVKGVLTYFIDVPGGGNHPVTVMTGGKVNKNRLVIHADGDDSNITPAILDELRDYGIEVDDVSQLGGFDNNNG